LIYRDKLKDHAAARRELRKVYADHTTSILRDDALWAEALLLRDDRDQDGACAAMEKLVRELPDSRYASCAREVCPSAPPAKRACRDYIVREARGITEREDAKDSDPESAP
jgi:hypothetical protein